MRVQNQNNGKWEKATIQEKVNPRSYTINTETGKVIRRNRRHIRESPEPKKSVTFAEPIESEAIITSEKSVEKKELKKLKLVKRTNLVKNQSTYLLKPDLEG